MTTDEIDIETIGLVWEKPHFRFDGEIFVPHIYELKEMGEFIPSGFNTVAIPLNGKVSADLDWNPIEASIQKYIDDGLKILWKLDLGLFKNLKAPLSNQTQFLSLILSLEHLRDTLWKKFQTSSLGVCLYCGPANFALDMPWDEQLEQNYVVWREENSKGEFQNADAYFRSLFARDAAAEYLTLMANRMPDAMQLFLDLEVDSFTPMLEMQLLNRERFDRFHLLTRNGQLPTLSTYQESSIGLCLPSFRLVNPNYYQNLEKVAQDLSNKKIAFRLIPEIFLINEWDGLDYLMVDSNGLSQQGKRKVQGFCAAGGTVISLGTSLNLPNEISYQEFRL